MSLSDKLTEQISKKVARKVIDKALYDAVTNPQPSSPEEEVVEENPHQEELENAGLDYEELYNMSLRERRKAIEDAGLDYDDYEELFYNAYKSDDDLRDELTNAGFDFDELCEMDSESREEAIEDAGLFYYNYEYLFYDYDSDDMEDDAPEPAIVFTPVSTSPYKDIPYSSKNKTQRKLTATLIIIFILAVVGIVGYHEYSLLTPLGYDEEDIIGQDYKYVVSKLESKGFTYFRTEEIQDLSIDEDSEENLVTDIEFVFIDSFDEDTKYPTNLPITITYHTVETFPAPITSKEAKGQHYSDVIESFENAGFVNISTVVEYDIIAGWFNEDGEVKSVSINGVTKYKSSDEFRLDAEVVITYHSLRKNQPK